MKKALIVTNDFPPIVSGIGTVFYNILRFLPKEDFFILCPWVKDCMDFDKKNNMRIIRMKTPIGESRLFKIIKTIANILYIFVYAIRLKIKSIHCGQILSNGIAGLICKKVLNIPYIVWVYGSETIRFSGSRLFTFLMKKVLSNAKTVVVNSSFTEEEYLDFGVDKNKVVKITPGVDTSIFLPRDKPERLLEKYNLYNKMILLTVARLDERKGHDMVIEALSILKDEYHDLAYVIVGRGREQERLQQIVNLKDIRDSVIFAGYAADDELPEYYNLSDIFVLPNRETEQTALKGDYEGFGIVFVEASACAKPVIGGLSGGVGDAIADGETGILINPRSVEDLVSAIKHLIDNPQNRKAMGIAGRIRAEKEFDWKVIAKRFEEIF